MQVGAINNSVNFKCSECEEMIQAEGKRYKLAAEQPKGKKYKVTKFEVKDKNQDKVDIKNDQYRQLIEELDNKKAINKANGKKNIFLSLASIGLAAVAFFKIGKGAASKLAGLINEKVPQVTKKLGDLNVGLVKKVNKLGKNLSEKTNKISRKAGEMLTNFKGVTQKQVANAAGVAVATAGVGEAIKTDKDNDGIGAILDKDESFLGNMVNNVGKALTLFT